ASPEDDGLARGPGRRSTCSPTSRTPALVPARADHLVAYPTSALGGVRRPQHQIHLCGLLIAGGASSPSASSASGSLRQTLASPPSLGGTIFRLASSRVLSPRQELTPCWSGTREWRRHLTSLGSGTAGASAAAVHRWSQISASEASRLMDRQS